MPNFYLGCDVSKGYADFVVIDHLKKITENNFQLDDTNQGHQRLEQFLQVFFDKNPAAILYAALESTGGYENNWFQSFKRLAGKFPVKLARLNPMGIHHHKRAGLKRNSTDKISALAIAEYQINHAEVIRYDEHDPYKSMKKLFTTYRMFLKIRTQMLNQLESLIYTANPELVKYRKDNTPKWLLRLLSEYPVAENLANARTEDLVRIPFINAGRAEDLISDARISVASATDETTQVLIKLLADQILELSAAIETLKKQAEDFVDVPEIKLLNSIDSIGTISAIGLFVEMAGDIGLFANAKKLSAFWGVHPILKESGDGSLVPKMSKNGRKLPRAILFMVVLSGIRTKNSFISNIYQRELRKGKCKMSAIGVCMNKMARVVYGVLKNNTPFDPEIDQCNQKCSRPMSSNRKDKAKVRRFQSEDKGAPISRKQNKKRKEREQSQGEPVTISEIKSSPLVAPI
jgi:transposase